MKWQVIIYLGYFEALGFFLSGSSSDDWEAEASESSMLCSSSSITGSKCSSRREDCFLEDWGCKAIYSADISSVSKSCTKDHLLLHLRQKQVVNTKNPANFAADTESDSTMQQYKTKDV